VAAEKNWNQKARAGKNSWWGWHSNLLPFCPPERLDFKIRNSDFRQKKFELISPKICVAGGIPSNSPSARHTCPPLAEKRPFQIEKLPKNLKKYRLELHFER